MWLSQMEESEQTELKKYLGLPTRKTLKYKHDNRTIVDVIDLWVESWRGEYSIMWIAVPLSVETTTYQHNYLDKAVVRVMSKYLAEMQK